MGSDEIRILGGLLIFIVGVGFTPVVELLKDRYNRKKLLQNLNEEFKDEIEYLKGSISAMASSIQTIEGLLKGQEQTYGPLTYIPFVSNFVFVEEVIKSNYRHLKKQQRRDLKAIPKHVKAMEINLEELARLKTQDENLETKVELSKNYILIACSMRELMTKFLLCSEKSELSYDQYIDKQLSEVGVTCLKCDDLKQKRKIQIKQR